MPLQTRHVTLYRLCRACAIRENGPYPFGLPRDTGNCEVCGQETATSYWSEHKPRQQPATTGALMP